MSRAKAKAKKEREPNVVPRMSDAEIKAFVRGYLGGHMTTSATVPQDLLAMVFMPLALGGLAGWKKKEVAEIGLIYADATKDQRAGRSINGYPMYASFRLMHKDDWAVAKATIIREQEKQTDIALEKP